MAITRPKLEPRAACSHDWKQVAEAVQYDDNGKREVQEIIYRCAACGDVKREPRHPRVAPQRATPKFQAKATYDGADTGVFENRRKP